MTLTYEELECDICNQATLAPLNAVGVLCSKDCKQVVLKPKVGYKFVELKCKKNFTCRVEDCATTVECTCCKDPVSFAVDSTATLFNNGQKIYKTEKITGFVQRRLDELKEAREGLKDLEANLAAKGSKKPAVKSKNVERCRKYSIPLPWSTVTSKCDGCGRNGKIYPTFFTWSCGYAKCPKKRLWRPLQPGVKYAYVKCIKSSVAPLHARKRPLHYLSLSLFVVLNLPSLSDTINAKIINDQPFLATVPSSPYIKILCQDLYDARNKLEAAKKELDHYTKNMEKKPSLWKRMLYKAREMTKKKANKEEKKAIRENFKNMKLAAEK